ncbi:hypothetical protein ACFWPH_32460 [Nocardia sp. NPDC058499]|uniref:hypothetical protein n=1 Tax=Nocardia sp. NPDC058499 TaxID=3346530 RepID=UPI003659380E
MNRSNEENSADFRYVRGVATTEDGADVRVRIWLSGRAFEYAIAAAAVGNLVADWKRQRWCGAIEFFSAPTSGVPRIPCERLYLGS